YAECGYDDDAQECPNRFHRSSMLAVDRQFAAFLPATEHAAFLAAVPRPPPRGAVQTRPEGPGGVERPAVGIEPNLCREAIRVGWAHPGATVPTISEAASTAAGDHRAVLGPGPGCSDGPIPATREAPGVRPVHESRCARERASGRRRECAAVAAASQ